MREKEASNKKLLPSLDSYQGRYTYVALLLTFLLLAISFLGNMYVQQISRTQVEKIEARSDAANLVANSRQQVRELESWLQNLIIDPDPVIEQSPYRGDELSRKLEELKSSIAEVIESPWSRQSENISEDLALLVSDTTQMERIALQFSDVVANIEKRLPSMELMQASMLPHSNAIVTTLNNLVYEIAGESDDSGERGTLLSMLYDIRHDWMNVILESRLLVANRFGAFSDQPQAGMAIRRDNVLIHGEQFRKNLEKLKNIPLSEINLFTDDLIWHELDHHHLAWFLSFRDMVDSLNSDDWRQDLSIFNRKVVPALARITDGLSALGAELDDQASHDITGLTNLASRLSNSIAFLALLGVALIAAAYFYLNRKIIRPIADTTLALKLEAKGAASNSLPTPDLEETRDLVEAFSEMRQQVNIRQQSLDHLAHHDPLTQLPNRALFKDRLRHAIAISQRNDQILGLMFLDLDKFKRVNDSLGHLVGDELLVEIAHRLRRSVRRTDTVARLSGDEFAILAEDIGNREFMAELAKKVLSTVQEKIIIDEHELHISTSIGIAVAPQDDKDADHLIRDADTAMYEAKRRGRAGYFFFSSELTHLATRHLLLERQLRHAIGNNEFLFHYQPIVSTAEGSPHGFEALMRWQPANKELRLPGSFLPMLIETGLHTLVSDELFRQIAALQKRVIKNLGIPINISINLSGPVLQNRDSYEAFFDALHESGISTEHLLIELTEDTLIEDLANAGQFLTRLKQMGAKIALDDFGTGQSSLNHLRMFPFDIIKIDREFVRDITTDKNDATPVRVIIQLAHSFNMEVVAEGVETAEQFEFLLHANCDYLQGFMISKPVPADQLMDYLRQQITNLKFN